MKADFPTFLPGHCWTRRSFSETPSPMGDRGLRPAGFVQLAMAGRLLAFPAAAQQVARDPWIDGTSWGGRPLRSQPTSAKGGTQRNRPFAQLSKASDGLSTASPTDTSPEGQSAQVVGVAALNVRSLNPVVRDRIICWWTLDEVPGLVRRECACPPTALSSGDH
jgi:hypothetical protein